MFCDTKANLSKFLIITGLDLQIKQFNLNLQLIHTFLFFILTLEKIEWDQGDGDT